MGTPAKTFTLIKGQELTINLNQIYINDYWSLFDVILNYGDNFVIGNFRPRSDYNYYVRSSDLTISQSINVNTLNYPITIATSWYPDKLYNNTDYVTQIKVKINTAGVFLLPFDYFYNKGSQPGNGNEIFTFNVVEPPPALTYNNAGIVYNKYDRVIRVEKNKTTQVSFGTDGLFPNGEQLIINSTLPAWITNNTIGSYTQTWSLAPTSTGTYYYNASAYLRNSFQGAVAITVIVVDSLYEEIDNCCSDENVNIVWLNRQGGRGNFIFTQRKDFNVEIGKKSTYLTNDIKRYSEIKNVHNGFKVYATGITKNQIDFLDTLRYSIQCWQFINGVFIPLILDIGSFEKYNTKENMYEISMNFLYAKRLNIQRQ